MLERKPKVSIIIRARNEARWISACLRKVFEQSFRDFEVILVDNNSTDRTVQKAMQHDVKIVSIDYYLPGKAINSGIAVSSGEYIAFLSAHCVPKDIHWLENLIRNFEDDHKKEIAGVYGRQEPLSFTSDPDKRDLLITFGLDRRVQVKDSFFHNANSMVRRDVVEKIPFDGTVTNIEDRLWAREVIKSGYKLVYEPTACVYHHHGIHQSNDRERAKNTVRILESIEEQAIGNVDISQLGLDISAIITARGEPVSFCGEPLINYTIQRARESEYLGRIFVSTDNEQTQQIALKAGAQAPFLRPSSLSRPHVGVEEVLRYSLEQLEKEGFHSDIIVYLSVLQPFRPAGLIDDLVSHLVRKGYDSVMAGYPVYKSCWYERDDEIIRVDDGFTASSVKKPIHIGYAGLACVSHAEYIREGRLLGETTGIFEILDYYSTIEVKTPAAFELAEKVFPHWWEKQKELKADHPSFLALRKI